MTYFQLCPEEKNYFRTYLLISKLLYLRQACKKICYIMSLPSLPAKSYS